MKLPAFTGKRLSWTSQKVPGVVCGLSLLVPDLTGRPRDFLEGGPARSYKDGIYNLTNATARVPNLGKRDLWVDFLISELHNRQTRFWPGPVGMLIICLWKSGFFYSKLNKTGFKITSKQTNTCDGRRTERGIFFDRSASRHM